jgi:hypothetical protein
MSEKLRTRAADRKLTLVARMNSPRICGPGSTVEFSDEIRKKSLEDTHGVQSVLGYRPRNVVRRLERILHEKFLASETFVRNANTTD